MNELYDKYTHIYEGKLEKKLIEDISSNQSQRKRNI